MSNPKEIKYETILVNEILDYLSKKPYIEVVGLIQKLQNGVPINTEDKADGKTQLSSKET